MAAIPCEWGPIAAGAARMERSFIAREQVCGSGVGEAGGEEGDRSLEGDAVPVVVGSGFDGGADNVRREGGGGEIHSGRVS